MLIRYNSKQDESENVNGKEKTCVKNKVRKIHHFDESAAKITRQQAIKITEKFLEQHHSISGASAVLREGKWFVTMCVGMSKDDTRQVRIDANTGKILDYT